MIKIKMTDICEGCYLADLVLEYTEIESFDNSHIDTTKTWDIRCKHENACNAMYDKVMQEYVWS